MLNETVVSGCKRQNPPQHLQALVVEDSEADMFLLVEALREGGFETDWQCVETETALCAALTSRKWDVVFSDYTMPRLDAPKVLSIVRDYDDTLPAIVVSGTVGEEMAVEVMRLGANDFVLKHNLDRLIPVLHRELGAARLRRERKQADEELRFQKTLLEAQSESSNDGILTVDGDAKIISFNRRFVEMWGVPEHLMTEGSDGVLLNAVLSNVVDPQHFLNRVRHLYEHRDLVSNDEVLLKDGKVFDRYTSAVKGADGTYYGRIWTFRDVTERKRAEQVLHESERRFRHMLENVELIALTVDKHGHVIFCNDYFLRMTGWRREEVIGNDWFSQFISQPYAGMREAYYGNIAAGTIPSHLENPILTKSGELREISWNNTMLRDGVGNIIGTSSIGEDVTDRKRAAEQIARQAALLDQTRDAVTVRNLEGRILYWNQGAERIFGWMSGEAVGRTMFEVLKENMADIEGIVDAMLEKGEWLGELNKVSKNGSKLTVDARWTLVRDSEGNPESILAIDTDITEKKKIEAQFLRAQRMDSIGALAGGIAHDLNNILSPIMLSVQMLMDMTTEPQSRSILEMVDSSAQRGADIVSQILSFARGVEGDQVKIQIKHLIKETEKVIRNTFPKNIRLETSVPYNTWTVSGDPTQLHQILLNLTVNARDAMPDGGVLIINAENRTLGEKWASVNTTAKPGPYVVITVRDSGVGMKPEIIEKIYEPFFTTKGDGKGTGLGLSTVLTIAKNHGGLIEVESEPGLGTTFSVHLPATICSQLNIEQEEQACLPRGDGEMILVVDDEESILTITREILEAFGYRVLTANNGVAAVTAYAKHRDAIAAVITDMMMPVKDGLSTVLALKLTNPNVKIVVASGVASKGHEASAMAADIKHFLQKPYTTATLLGMLAVVLNED